MVQTLNIKDRIKITRHARIAFSRFHLQQLLKKKSFSKRKFVFMNDAPSYLCWALYGILAPIRLLLTSFSEVIIMSLRFKPYTKPVNCDKQEEFITKNNFFD